MNKAGVALAADSALTIGKERVWKSSNKLFSISRHNRIGLMIYGNSEFNSVPLEVIVKSFRKEIGKTEFESVEAARIAFESFLKDYANINSQQSIEDQYIVILEWLEKFRSSIESDKAMEFRRKLRALIKSFSERLDEYDTCIDAKDWAEQSNEFSADVLGLASEIFDQKITKGLGEELLDVWRKMFGKAVPTSDRGSGLVFVGYGSNDVFPSLSHGYVDGVICGQTRIWKRESYHIADADPHSAGMIWSFAQTDVAALFMNEVSDRNRDFFSNFLSSILKERSESIIAAYVPDGEQLVEQRLQDRENQKLVRGFEQEFEDYLYEQSASPILTVVGSLPKEEMASTAEAMVELTSLKRKFDSTVETVGGPVDVAVISGGDGFVWIKRKHYFDADKNPDYMLNRQEA